MPFLLIFARRMHHHYKRDYTHYRVQKWWRHKKLFLHFCVLKTIYQWNMMKIIHSPNLVQIDSWEPKIWPHEYLISPTEVCVNGLVPISYEPRQFTLFSMGFIRYSCRHISGHHEPIHAKFGLLGFFIMFYWNMVIKCWNAKKKKKKMISHFSALYIFNHLVALEN